MRWLPLIILLAGCSESLEGNLSAEKQFDLVRVECFGWCRMSSGNSDGGLTFEENKDRTAGDDDDEES